MANDAPMTLELAPLPRTQTGPFLILGVDKDASRDAIESGWAQRLIWARKGLIAAPLEDINWARETLGDSAKRHLYDASTLNPDTTAGVLRMLLNKTPISTPLEDEKDLSGFSLPGEIPDAAELRASITAPELPGDLPAARALLEGATRAKIDPWDVF